MRVIVHARRTLTDLPMNVLLARFNPNLQRSLNWNIFPDVYRAINGI